MLRDATSQARQRFGKAGFEAGDATSVEDVQRVTAAARAFMGGIDTIVVSAGAGGRTSVFDTEPAEFQRIVDHTLRPAFLAVRYASADLVAAGKGSVIIISSMLGLVGQRERLAYCGAKAGVIGMVKAMALDFADKGVRVNAMCPGFVETPLALEVTRQEADPEAALRAKRLDASPFRAPARSRRWASSPSILPPICRPSSPARRSRSMAATRSGSRQRGRPPAARQEDGEDAVPPLNFTSTRPPSSRG